MTIVQIIFGFLKLHKKIHEKQIQYTCDPCGFHTHSYLQIQAHRAKHRGDHKCDLCEYRTTRSDYLKRHKKAHHTYTENVRGVISVRYALLKCGHTSY